MIPNESSLNNPSFASPNATTSDLSSQMSATPALAPIWRRLFAYIIDIILLGLMDFILILLHIHLFFPIYVCYFFWFFSTSGQTVGALVLTLKVVREDGGHLTAKVGILRVAGFLFSTMVFGLGFLSMFWDTKRQAWYDKAAGTIVITTKA